LNRQEVITIVESLANGVDPATGARIPADTFHRADIVRALFAASTLLKSEVAAAPVARSGRTRGEQFTSAGTPGSAEEDARLG
jgi:hypothetical protein